MQVRRSWFGEGSEQIMTEREQAEMHRRSPFSSVLIIIQLFWIMEELRSLPWTSFHTKADLDNISLSKICILPTQVPFVYFIKPSTTPILFVYQPNNHVQTWIFRHTYNSNHSILLVLIKLKITYLFLFCKFLYFLH